MAFKNKFKCEGTIYIKGKILYHNINDPIHVLVNTILFVESIKEATEFFGNMLSKFGDSYELDSSTHNKGWEITGIIQD